MKSSFSHLFLACSFFGLLLLASSASAQYRASLRGTVTDPSGAAVPGAKVTLVDRNTNRTIVSTSDPNGIYQFNALPPAPYRLTAEADGFKQKVLENVQIIPEQPNALDLTLDVGGSQETVTVSGTTQALDTETANWSGTISSNQIQHLPSFGRDVLKVAELAPGAIADNSQAAGNDNYNLPGTNGQTGGGQSGGADGIFKTENGVPIMSNGNQTQNNGVSIDGISTESSVWGGATIITPSEDSVDNVKVLSNNYDAEYGRFSGAQIQITSKSGSNDFHGSLFFTTHQPNLNAFQPYNGTSKPVRDENHFEQLGGSIGGPIWKNKLFFFFNYETVREPNSNITGSGWYDTPAFDALAPTGSIAAKYLSFPGNAVVGSLDPHNTCADAGLSEGVNCRTIAGQGINVGTPLTTPLGSQDTSWTSTSSPGIGNGLGTVADIANYDIVNPTTFNASQYNGRLDANLTETDRIGFAIYWVPLSRTNYTGANRSYDLFHHDQINDAFSAIWNHTFSSSFLNEARVNAAGWRWNEITSNPQSPVGFPTDFFGQTGSITLNQFGPSVGSILNQWTYGYKDVATKIIGRHTVKFGGDVTRLFYLQNCTGCGVPNYTFFNIWDFLNDAPHQEGGGFSPTTGFPTTIRQDDRENFWGLFVQDDFKLRRNLTINVGVRWSYFGPLYSKENNMLAAVPGSGPSFLTGLNIRKGNTWNPQKNNFGPQLGFAWSPGMFNDKLVVRGGYGLNYNQEEIAVSSGIVNNPGLVIFPSLFMATPTSPNPGIIYATAGSTNSFTTYPRNQNTISTFGPNGLPTSATVGGVSVAIFPGTLPTMRVHHFSLDTEYELGHNVVATLGYQGSISRDILFHESPNAVAATSGLNLNPQVAGYSDYWNTNGYGNYNAMLAELKHQFATQFMADAQFTWAKSMDTSSGPYFQQPYPYNLNLDYGRSDYNIGKALKLYGVWQPVFFHGGKSWLDKVVGGWSISPIFNIHSGFPWTPVTSVVGGVLYCGNCNAYGTLYPGAYLGGAGTSTSNDAFKTTATSNFPKGGAAYFATPSYTAFGCSSTACAYGNAIPEPPGVRRNSLNMPGYKDLDLTITKAFGLPNTRWLGESAKIELRMDAYNVFNNLNLNPNEISNNIANSNFGTITGALSGRVLVLGGRFSF